MLRTPDAIRLGIYARDLHAIRDNAEVEDVVRAPEMINHS